MASFHYTEGLGKQIVGKSVLPHTALLSTNSKLNRCHQKSELCMWDDNSESITEFLFCNKEIANQLYNDIC